MTKTPVGYLLSDVSRLVRKKFQNDPEIGCITLAQAKALNIIARNEGIKQVELAELLEIKPMTVARVIDQLVAEGLVKRCASPSDRRAHLIYLLPEAKSRLNIVSSVGNKVWESGLAGLTEQQRDQFIATLEHIHRNLSDN
ncbi:MarR family winged helix-turn-helix transcriptional regulator [Vibrio algivorus]|uniref:Transcriptional regulator n=1 Tax=Vibrio algivorus TaxID=1667024 RepID=A0ABQ6ERT4_9VIBR|nr:MarR family winged helix-turn-helix transcriptional regulator [Vibrio algivorus]GLT15848.1 transcriptional regulator [Vibrio algivorus]